MPIHSEVEERNAAAHAAQQAQLNHAQFTAQEAIRNYATSQGEGWAYDEGIRDYSNNNYGPRNEWANDDPHKPWLDQAKNDTGIQDIDSGNDWGQITDYYNRKLNEFNNPPQAAEATPAAAPEQSNDEPVRNIPIRNSRHIEEAKERVDAYQANGAESSTFDPAEHNPDTYDRSSEYGLEDPEDGMQRYDFSST